MAAVIAYPDFYPTKASHHTSIFVEIAYSGPKGSGQASYQTMEINLEALRDAKMYSVSSHGAKRSPPPLTLIDPRTVVADDVSIVSFTTGDSR